MDKILDYCVSMLKSGDEFALTTIVHSQGSAPRGAGAVMVVKPCGTIYGSVGGGVLEAKAIAQGTQVIADGGGSLIDFDLTSDDVAGSDMICGGKGTLTVMKVTVAMLPIFEEALAATKSRAGGYLETAWQTGGSWQMQYLPEGDGAIRGLQKAADGSFVYRLSLCDGGKVLIFGAGHVSCEIAALCRRVGFPVTVVDDREKYANEVRFPDCCVQVLRDFQQPPVVVLGKRDYIIIATRGHLHDASCLAWAMEQKVDYIGMIGSRRKKTLLFEQLKAMGYSREDLSRIHTPVGLEIQAQTPAEIAVSIVAQLIERRASMRSE